MTNETSRRSAPVRRHRKQPSYEHTLMLVLMKTFGGLLALTLLVLAADRLIINSQWLREAGSFLKETGETIRILSTEVSAAQHAGEPELPPDTTPPVLYGVGPILAYEGDAVSYRVGVSVTDDRDLVPELHVNTELVDLTTPGIYPVVYSATDDAGNVTRAETTIEIQPRKEGYASVEEIYQAADALLAELTYRDQPQYLQVIAIYDWLHKNCQYVGHSDKSDEMQAAYQMLTQRQGDCFNYFSVSKLLFERLGIKNMDVRKVKLNPEDSDHYWSLVSLDGGDTWYHFDATPRLGQTENFCLTSDSVIDTYSDNHGGSHHRDASLYPATPEAPYGQ